MLPIWARSHHRFMQPVMKTLAEAGHQVIVYSPFPMENPPKNYTDVKLENISTESDVLTKWFLEIAESPKWKCLEIMHLLKDMMFDEFFKDKKFLNLLKSKEKFDLIFTESLLAQEYTLILGYIFNAPVIVLNSFNNSPIVKRVLGSPLGISYMPGVCMAYSNSMTLYERAVNAFSILRYQYIHYNQYLPQLEDHMKKLFPEMPPLLDLMDNIALVFLNSYSTCNYPEPLAPNIIPIAGIHIPETVHLPQDIQEFMDEALSGVILFSLGTYVADELLSKSYFDMYIEAFKQLPQRILWKTRKENIENLPSNVLIKQWMPQTDILAHPNCVLFITHGGLHSTIEAIHHGVPVVVIPQFADQPHNARYLEHQGVGRTLAANSLSERSIYTALRSVIDNTSYTVNMKRLSRIFRDRPLSPAQSVVYWTEYVLRHGGASHLRPASARLSWYQLALLDVLVCVLAVLVTVLVLCNLLLYRVLTYLGINYNTDKNKKLN